MAMTTRNRERWAGIALCTAVWMATPPVPAVSAPAAAVVVVTGEGCQTLANPADLLPAGLASEFARYRPHVQRCPVARPSEPAALSVISVRNNDYYTSLPGVPVKEAIPAPLLIASDNTIVGRPPVPFPDDGPVSATLHFGSWHGNWPQILRISFESDAPGPPRAIVLTFNPTTRSFERKAGSRS